MGVSGFPAVQGGAPWVNGGTVAAGGWEPDGGRVLHRPRRRHVSDCGPVGQRRRSPTRSSSSRPIRHARAASEPSSTSRTSTSRTTRPASRATCSRPWRAPTTTATKARLGATIGVKNADPSAKLVMGGLSGRLRVGRHVDQLNHRRSSTPRAPGRRRTAAALSRPMSSTSTITASDRAAPAPAAQPRRRRRQGEARGGRRVSRPAPARQAGLVDGVRLRHLRAVAVARARPRVELGVHRARAVARARAPRGRSQRGSSGPPSSSSTTPARPRVGLRYAIRDRGSACDRRYPKPAWYYLATFRARLSSYRYVGTVPATRADVNVAQFADMQGSGGAFVVWMGTSNASVTASYALSLRAGTSTAKAVALTDGQATGVERR